VNFLLKPFGCLLSLVSGLVTLIVVTLLLFWIGFGFVVTPLVERKVASDTGLEVEMDSSSLNPFTASIRFEDLRIMNPESLSATLPMLRIREASFEGSWTRSYDGKKLQIDEATVTIERLNLLSGGGSSNLAILLAEMDNWLAGGSSEGVLKLWDTPVHIDVLTVILDTVAEGQQMPSGAIQTTQQQVSYRQTFTDVTQWRPVVEQMSSDLRSRGFSLLGRELDPPATGGLERDTAELLRRVLEGFGR
jgi:hypothetical protein